MKNLGAAMAGGNGKRRDNEFYPTPPDPVFALFEQLRDEMDLKSLDAWECACGDGAMSRILEIYFRSVVSTDLIGRGYGESGVDFLKATELRAPVIVTNPPFSLAEKFIRHSHALGASHLMLLLKSTYWHAASRISLFEQHPPTVIAPLTFRTDFSGQKRPTMELGWFLWEKDRSGPPATRLLPRVETPFEGLIL